jgi:hypothetical protein
MVIYCAQGFVPVRVSLTIYLMRIGFQRLLRGFHQGKKAGPAAKAPIRELRNVVERLLLLADGEVDGGAVELALPNAKRVAGGAASAFLQGLCQSAWPVLNAKLSWRNWSAIITA